ncbi:MAG: AraC family transcriptional regulator [Verrucomicrobiota bacterium]|jgi:AraC family transcriptional regulator
MNVSAKPATLRFYKERLLCVLVHIQQHLDEPLALDDLARLACLAPHHFHHVFTGMLGESLGSHVRRLRLERAACQLKLTKTPVVQVAFEAAYQTHEAFSRAFRKAFGLSPVQFRGRNGVSARIQTRSGVHYRRQKPPGSFRAAQLEDKTMKVTVKNLQPIRVAFMRHIGPYNQVGKIWDRFTMLLGKEGLLGSAPQFIGISLDDPAVTPPDKTRYDACVAVDAKFRASGEIGVQVIPGGDYAVLTHFGPYEKLGQSYARLLGQWLPRSGRRLRATPCLELYFNSPENTDPEDLVTDIHAPLETK